MLKYAHIDVKDSDTRPTGPQVDSVRIEWLEDEHADVSHLETTADEYYGTGWPNISAEAKAKVIAEHGSISGACEAYAAEDAKRLRAFNRGDWHMCGCIAFATVSTDAGQGCRRLQEFQSAGLWGIASDDPDRRAFEAGQLADLAQHLEGFGVDTSNIWELAGIPADHERL